MRADKRLEAFHDLYNVVKSALEKSEAQKGKALILDCGNVGLWYHVEQAGRFEAASALGVYQPPRAYVLARMALETCGWAFCFERYCFISERPESFHHPQLSKDQPRDRIIVKWRDGFVCDKELWF